MKILISITPGSGSSGSFMSEKINGVVVPKSNIFPSYETDNDILNFNQYLHTD